MNKKGFTIIELLIVITIIGILIGVAVPYYNDYLYDARLSVVKQNLATWRNTINQFRGDNVRGPFLVQVASGAATIHDGPFSRTTTGSELVAGPIQIINNMPTRRDNIKYLQSLPVIQDPTNGADIPTTQWIASGSTAYFYDNASVGIFNIDTELAFIDNDNNASYTAGVDQKLFTGTSVTGSAKALDYTTITVTGFDGTRY